MIKELGSIFLGAFCNALTVLLILFFAFHLANPKLKELDMLWTNYQANLFTKKSEEVTAIGNDLDFYSTCLKQKPLNEKKCSVHLLDLDTHLLDATQDLGTNEQTTYKIMTIIDHDNDTALDPHRLALARQAYEVLDEKLIHGR